MRIALLGDIHGNLEALEAVLADAKEQGCDDWVSLGDIVGYGPNPAECIQKIRELECPVVKGNHDEDSSNNRPLDNLSTNAKISLEWTREQLSEEDKAWLRKLRMVRQVEGFTIVHSTLDQPQKWHYVMNKFDAMSNFSYQFTPICFHGHTHIPQVYRKAAKVETLEPSLLSIEPGVKYFINVGAVGQPRDYDPRACYVVYDVLSQALAFRRVDYDVEQTQQKIRAANLPEALASRLSTGH